MNRVIASFILLAAAVWVTLPASGQAVTITAQSLEIDLGADFTTQAELVLPAGAEVPYPLAILIHGSGPYDMDASIYTPQGDLRSANFRLTAESLATQGIAVLRYNKRGVLGAGEYDFAQVQTSDLDRLVMDASIVLDTALTLPDIDPEAIYLYGWSEGAVVAANIAAARPDDLAGVILHGSPNGSLATVLPYQNLELGIPYLHRVTDANGDGALTLNEIATIPPVSGAVSLMPGFYLYDRTSTPQNPRVNTFTDQNSDGVISIDDELRPVIEMFITNYDQYAPQTDASWSVGDLLAQSGVPAFLLHGESDGWVPVETAAAITDSSSATISAIIYEGLGHALSPTEDPVLDAFDEIAQAPLDDIVAWIKG